MFNIWKFIIYYPLNMLKVVVYILYYIIHYSLILMRGLNTCFEIIFDIIIFKLNKYILYIISTYPSLNDYAPNLNTRFQSAMSRINANIIKKNTIRLIDFDTRYTSPNEIVSSKYYCASILLEKSGDSDRAFTLLNEIHTSQELNHNDRINVQVWILHMILNKLGTPEHHTTAYTNANTIYKSKQYSNSQRINALYAIAIMTQYGRGTTYNPIQALTYYKKILKSKIHTHEFIPNMHILICNAITNLLPTIYYETHASTEYINIIHDVTMSDTAKLYAGLYLVCLLCDDFIQDQATITDIQYWLTELIRIHNVDPYDLANVHFIIAIIEYYIIGIRHIEALIYFTKVATNPHANGIIYQISTYQITLCPDDQFYEQILQIPNLNPIIRTALQFIQAYDIYASNDTLCITAFNSLNSQCDQDYIKLLTQYAKYHGVALYRDIMFVGDKNHKYYNVSYTKQIQRLLYRITLISDDSSIHDEFNEILKEVCVNTKLRSIIFNTLELDYDIWKDEDNWDIACDFVEILQNEQDPCYWDLLTYHTQVWCTQFREYKIACYGKNQGITNRDLTPQQLTKLIQLVRDEESRYTSPYMIQFMKYVMDYPQYNDLFHNIRLLQDKLVSIREHIIIDIKQQICHIEDELHCVKNQYQGLHTTLMHPLVISTKLLSMIVEKRNEIKILEHTMKNLIIRLQHCNTIKCDEYFTERAIRGASIVNDFI